MAQVSPAQPTPLATGSTPVLIIDTLKLAEPPLTAAASAGDAGAGVCLVVRLYEPHGCRGTARLSWDPEVLPVSRAVACNLLEEEEEGGEVLRLDQGWGGVDGVGAGVGAARGRDAPGLVLAYSPFKVMSLKLYLDV